MLVSLLAFVLLATSQSPQQSGAPPTNLWAAQTSRTDIGLSWKRAPNTVRYRIYKLEGTTARLIGTAMPSADWYVQRITEYGVPYRYAIEAISENGAVSERVPFNEVVPVDEPPAPLSAPLSVTATPSGDGAITLSWTPVAGATGYVISRAATSGGSRVICRLCPPTAKYIDGEAVPGAKQIYSVQAVSAHGPSRLTRSAEVTPTGTRPGPTIASTAPLAGTVHNTPTPGSCLALGQEGNIYVRLSDGTVTARERVHYRARGMEVDRDPQFVPVEGVRDVVAIASSSAHSLALRSDGTILAWGENGAGQLASEEATVRRDGIASLRGFGAPSPVREITSAVGVATGFRHSAALLADGTIRMWGAAEHGIQGNGPATQSANSHITPGPVPGIDNAVQIAANGFFTFALLKDGTIRAWGWNRMASGVHGALGIGSDEEHVGTPQPVLGIDTAVAVAAGSGVGAALLRDGTVRGWGFGYGPPATGRGRARASNKPVPIPGITNAIAISPYMALLADGTVREFPEGDWPWQTPPIKNAVAIASDHVNRIALLADGTLMSWGRKAFYPNGPVTLVKFDPATAAQCAPVRR